MAQLRALNLLIVVITIINNSSCDNHMSILTANWCASKEILFSNSTDTVELENKDYKLDSNQAGYDLSVINNEKLSAIKKIKEPIIEFCMNEIKQKAKGNNILSSKVPENADYFFPLNDQGFVFITKVNVLTLRKIL